LRIWLLSSPRFVPRLILPASSSVRAASGSPSASCSSPRRGSSCQRRCWLEHLSASLRPLAPFIAAVRTVNVDVGASILLLPFGLLLFASPRFVLSASLLVGASFCPLRPLAPFIAPVRTAINPASVVVGSSSLQLPFGLSLFASPRFALSASL
jgi:hypothetical protein